MFRCVENSRPYRQIACLFLLFIIYSLYDIWQARGSWNCTSGRNGRDLFSGHLSHFFFQKCDIQIDAGSRSCCCVFSHVKYAGTPYCRVASHNTTESMSNIHVTSNGFGEPLRQASVSATAGSSSSQRLAKTSLLHELYVSDTSILMKNSIHSVCIVCHKHLLQRSSRGIKVVDFREIQILWYVPNFSLFYLHIYNKYVITYFVVIIYPV